MRIYGDMPLEAAEALQSLLSGQEGLQVRRRAPARSSVPHPQSTNLEVALEPTLVAASFEHHVGVVLVPRYKWISSKRADTNHAATLKALAFADRYMAVEALVMFAYDWVAGSEDGLWRLTFPDAEL